METYKFVTGAWRQHAIAFAQVADLGACSRYGRYGEGQAPESERRRRPLGTRLSRIDERGAVLASVQMPLRTARRQLLLASHITPRRTKMLVVPSAPAALSIDHRHGGAGGA